MRERETSRGDDHKAVKDWASFIKTMALYLRCLSV